MVDRVRFRRSQAGGVFVEAEFAHRRGDQNRLSVLGVVLPTMMRGPLYLLQGDGHAAADLRPPLPRTVPAAVGGRPHHADVPAVPGGDRCRCLGGGADRGREDVQGAVRVCVRALECTCVSVRLCCKRPRICARFPPFIVSYTLCGFYSHILCSGCLGVWMWRQLSCFLRMCMFVGNTHF